MCRYSCRGSLQMSKHPLYIRALQKQQNWAGLATMQSLKSKASPCTQENWLTGWVDWNHSDLVMRLLVSIYDLIELGTQEIFGVSANYCCFSSWLLCTRLSYGPMAGLFWVKTEDRVLLLWQGTVSASVKSQTHVYRVVTRISGGQAVQQDCGGIEPCLHHTSSPSLLALPFCNFPTGYIASLQFKHAV